MPAFDIQELFAKAQERASQTIGPFATAETDRKVGDEFGGQVVDLGELVHPEYGWSPATLLKPLADKHRVINPADPGTDKTPNYADLTNVVWVGTVLKSAYLRLMPEIGDLVIGRVTGQRQSRQRSAKADPYWDWNVVVYDPNTGNPKLPAAMRGVRMVEPGTGEVHGAARPGPGQEQFPAFTEENETADS